jgi:PAB1-binding protein PBP1
LQLEDDCWQLAIKLSSYQAIKLSSYQAIKLSSYQAIKSSAPSLGLAPLQSAQIEKENNSSQVTPARINNCPSRRHSGIEAQERESRQRKERKDCPCFAD